MAFIPWQSSGEYGIVTHNGTTGKIVYKGSYYNWILGKSASGGRTVTVYVTYVLKDTNGRYLWVASTMNQDGITYGND